MDGGKRGGREVGKGVTIFGMVLLAVYAHTVRRLSVSHGSDSLHCCGSVARGPRASFDPIRRRSCAPASAMSECAYVEKAVITPFLQSPPMTL